jgi:thiamine-phosphate diphosphorylase
MIPIPSPAVCLVTDRRRLAPDARTARQEIAALERFLEDAVSAGVDVIQLRERDLDGGVLADITGRLVGRARGSAVRVLVNDRADVALAAGAHGVHLPGDGPPVHRVRALSSSWIVGRSIHAADRPSGHQDASYLLFGPVYATASKPGAPAAGLSALASAAAAATPPVLAIGGIDPARAAECRRHGAAGVAGIGVFLPPGLAPESLGPVRAVQELRAALLELPPPSNG